MYIGLGGLILIIILLILLLYDERPAPERAFRCPGGSPTIRGQPCEREETAMAEDEAHEVVTGEGYAVGNIDALGSGGGFRKIRPALNVQALGINAIVMPADVRRPAPLPLRAGGDVLHPPGPRRARVRRRLGAPARARAGSRASTRPPCAGSATSATTTSSTSRSARKEGYVENDGHLLPSEETG